MWEKLNYFENDLSLLQILHQVLWDQTGAFVVMAKEQTDIGVLRAGYN
jgi:hypothetical protein